MKKQLRNSVFTAILFALGGLSYSVQAQHIAGGRTNSLFICADGSARSCGYNVNGELGDGTKTERNTTVQVTGLSNVTAVAAGDYFSLFLKSDSTVWACGINTYGQLGNGTTKDTTTATKISSLSGIIAISAGTSHCLFLKSDGTVWSCGYNFYGQLGDASTNDAHTPIQVSGVSGITAISAGDAHSMFLKNDGTVWVCGSNGSGRFGDGTTTANHTPFQLTTVSGIKAISAGLDHSLFLKNDGTVWGAGSNSDGQLGDKSFNDRHTPVQMGNLNGVVVTAIAAGNYFSLILKNDSTVWATGDNNSYELGDNGAESSRDSVKAIASATGVVAIAAGNEHNLFMKKDGTVWSCGFNGSGECGDGTSGNYKKVIVKVSGLCSVTTGIQEAEVENDVVLYPNPSNGKFFVKSAQQISSIEILNILGAQVYAAKVGADKTEIDLSAQPKGIYIYRLLSNDKNLGTGKIIIE